MYMKLAEAGLGYLQKSRAAKNQAAWDRYNNKMAQLTAAQSQNTVTENVALNKEQHAKNKVLVNSSRLVAAAKVKAGAAAAGVAGGAVEATLFSIGRNAGNRLASETSRMDTSLLVTDQQRRSISLAAKNAQKPITQGPSLLAALGAAGLDILADAEEDANASSGTNLEGGKLPKLSGLDKIMNML